MGKLINVGGRKQAPKHSVALAEDDARVNVSTLSLNLSYSSVDVQFNVPSSLSIVSQW